MSKTKTVGPSLDKWSQTLRPYQADAISRALSVPHGYRKLLLSPTGTGKGTIQLGLLRALLARGEDAWIVTPSLEVLRGYLERCGATAEDLSGSSAQLNRLGKLIRTTTPVRFRNWLEKGKITKPSTLIMDEAHHAVVNNLAGGGLHALCPNTTWIGFTATGYRGNPEETAELRLFWGEPDTVLTIPQAVENGSWALPSWRVVPLVDDDTCGIKAGDLDADEITLNAVDPLATLIQGEDLKIPTCVTVPSVDSALALSALLDTRNVPNRVVVGGTPTSERAEVYDLAKKGGTVVVSVRVLGEGVDFPWLDRWIDASPTMSPVSFIQKLGRITRPGRPKYYIGTNRNLERHGYLLQGLLPRDVIKDAQEAFGGPSMRGGRAGMIKLLAKLKPIPLPLTGGVKGTMWYLWEPSEKGGRGIERVVMLDPTSDRVVSGMRELKVGNWQDQVPFTHGPLPNMINGLKAAKLGGPATDAQVKWWKSEGKFHGLDVDVRPNKAQFSALPVLSDLQVSMDHNKPITKAEKRPKPANGAPPPRPGASSPTLAPGAAAPSQQPRPQEAGNGPPAVRAGYYTVTRENGSHRTYRLRHQAADADFAPGRGVLDMLVGPDNTGSYSGVGFVDGTTVSVWRRLEKQKPEIEQDWAAIVGDGEGAGKRYAQRSGNCYRCARLLTHPSSIASGIGPDCATRE